MDRDLAVSIYYTYMFDFCVYGGGAVFKYGAGAHNVVAVNKAAYDTCKTPRGAKVYRSGNDQIRLTRGQNYFICNYVGHCESGMKIAINAA